MQTYIDHIGREVTISYPPKRIISLCPAITETMYHIGLADNIVGRTKFCIHPKEQVEQALKVGGTKGVKLERIHQLQPDLIIAEKEENTKEMVQMLEKHYPVYVFEIQTIHDAEKMMIDLGKLTNHIHKATQLKIAVDKAIQHLPIKNGIRAAYMIWKNPYMVVGGDTYIQSMLDKMGFINPFLSYDGRYIEVTEQDLVQANLDYLFLATEPYPFKEKHFASFKTFLPHVKPLIVDGEMLWYGSAMLKTPTYFTKCFSHL